ncbi:MAG: hypothetical protein LBP59_20320 [Planctomycetaceae bacterium]|jgi:hypothetical protein|nr:hypothetical protein [Planctomycetaceae bacterium]
MLNILYNISSLKCTNCKYKFVDAGVCTTGFLTFNLTAVNEFLRVNSLNYKR